MNKFLNAVTTFELCDSIVRDIIIIKETQFNKSLLSFNNLKFHLGLIKECYFINYNPSALDRGPEFT